jgi:hypothetical protein
MTGKDAANNVSKNPVARERVNRRKGMNQAVIRNA